MIPDHIIEKAIRALITSEGRDPDDHCEEWKYDAHENDVRIALEAVAADIWGSGYNYGGSDELMRTLGAITDNERTPNPYRASEDA